MTGHVHVPGKVADQLLAGGVWALIARMGSIAGSVVLTLILARWLSPADLGAYFLALSMTTIASNIGQMGLGKAAVKLFSGAVALGERGKLRRIHGLVFGFGGLGGCSVGLILAVGPGDWIATHVFDTGRLHDAMLIVGAIAGLKVISRLIAESFRGLHRIREAVLFEGVLANWILVVSFAVGMSLTPKIDVYQVLQATLVATGLVASAGALILRREVPEIRPGIGRPSVSEVFELAWPLYIAALASVLINNLDLWLVGYLLPEESVAIYGIALKLMLVVSIPLTVVNAVIPPMIGELTATGQLAELEDALRGSITFAALPASLAAGAMVLAGGPIIRLAFGSQYATREAGLVAAILALGQLASVLAGSCGFTLMMSGHQREFMRSTLLGAGVTLIAALLLGREYGVTGVAIGAASGLVLQNAVMWWLVRVRLHIWTHVAPSRVPDLLKDTIRMIGNLA